MRARATLGLVGTALGLAAGALLWAPGRSPAQNRRELRWEFISSTISLQRAKVPGGWLVALEQPSARGTAPFHSALTFYPDPDHRWDGGSLP